VRSNLHFPTAASRSFQIVSQLHYSILAIDLAHIILQVNRLSPSQRGRAIAAFVDIVAQQHPEAKRDEVSNCSVDDKDPFHHVPACDNFEPYQLVILGIDLIPQTFALLGGLGDLEPWLCERNNEQVLVQHLQQLQLRTQQLQQQWQGRCPNGPSGPMLKTNLPSNVTLPPSCTGANFVDNTFCPYRNISLSFFGKSLRSRFSSKGPTSTVDFT